MSSQQKRGWWQRNVFRRRKAARRKTPYGCQLSFEALEARQLLSINWTNRGETTGDDNDRFDLVFGPLAGQARGVVDAAIDFWERSINSFNYGDGGNDIYEMKVQMNEFPVASGSGVAANGGFTNTRNGKPSEGGMGIGWLLGVVPGINSAAGYFLDPTPYESSEFQGTHLNGFARQNTGNIGGADLFTLTLHELGHAMGLAVTAQTDAYALDTEFIDNVNMPASNPVSTLWLFDNGSLWTEWDSGGAGGAAANFAGPQHFAPLGTTAVRLGVTYSGAVALMNASFTSRSIISDIEMDAARLAYGYTVTPPSRYGTTYGQLDSDGTLRIDTSSLGNSADSITLSGSGSVLSLTLDTGAPVAGIDPAGAILSIFDLSAVQQIEINTGAGSDTITIGAGVPATEIIGGIPPAGGGPDTDTLIINGATGNNTLTSGSFIGGFHNITAINGIEDLTVNGTAGNENFFFNSLPAHGNIRVNAGAGTNNLYLGGGDLVANIGTVASFTYTGGTGGDGLIVSNQNNNSLNWTNEVLPDFIDFIAAGFYLAVNYTAVESVTIEGSQRNDQFVIGAVAPLVTANGNDGNDNFIVGGGNMTGFVPQIFNGGPGTDQITFDDHLDPTNRIWDIRDNEVIFGGLISLFTSGFESVGLLAGTGNDEITFKGNLSQSFDIDGGGGNETFIIGFQTKAQFLAPVTIRGGLGNDNYQWTRGSNNWYQGIVDTNLYDVLLDGGTGYNTLAIDETTRSAAGYYLYADRFYATDGAVFPVGFDIDYDNMLAMSLSAGDGTTNVGVYGTSSDIDPGNQISISLAGGADNVYLYPHDAQGNLTINGNVGIGGGTGTDSLFVDDSGSSAPAAYAFANPFGAGTQNITGVGSGGFGIANDFEAITMTGSVGNDVYSINSFKSGMGLTINGGLGDDVCDFGNGDVAANITSIASFNFDGQGGYDTFTLNNDNNANPWNYTRTASFLRTDRLGGSTYFLILNQQNVEFLSATGGTQPDQFFIQTTPSGTISQFDGAGGDDSYLLGNAMSTDGIIGGVYLYNSLGTDSISIDDRADTTGKTLHVDQYFVGGAAGDNLFGSGGFLYYVGIAGAMTIKLGSGGDTVYAAPNPSTPIFIEGNGPAGAGSGSIGGSASGGLADFTGLAFANAANPVFTPGGAGEGAYVFDNAAFFYYSGMESTEIDDIAPYIVAQSYDDMAVPTIYVEFSEDVSNALSVSFLELINTTNSEQVPFGYLDMGYDTNTNIASFTFPGYPGGVLPAGEYTALIYNSLPDLFGNSMNVETPFQFSVLASVPTLLGDYNENDVIDAADYAVWRDALTAGSTSLPNDPTPGTVDESDFLYWRAHFGETLGTGAGSAALAEVTAEQSLTGGSGAAALAAIEPAIQIGKAVEQTPSESTSTPVVPEVENTRAPTLAILDSRFARHDSASRPWVRINAFRVAELAHDNLLLLLANDRVGRPLLQDFSAANDRKDNDHREDALDSQSLTDELLALPLAEWR